MTSAWSNGEIEPMGFRIWGPEPIRDVYLPINSPFSILYGRNGAGKSRLLGSIQACLTGDSQGGDSLTDDNFALGRNGHRAALFLRCTDKPCAPDDVFGRQLATAVARRAFVGREALEFFKGRTWREVMSDLLLARFRGQRTDTALPGLREELAGQGILALCPTGDWDKPAWQVWLAVVQSDETPVINAAIREYHQRQAELDPLQAADNYSRWSWAVDMVEELGLPEALATGLDRPIFGAPMLVDDIPKAVISLRPCAVYGLPSSDPEAETVAVIDRLAQRHGFALFECDSRDPSPDFVALLENLGHVSSSLFGRLLEEAPELVCVLSPPESWNSASRLQWLVREEGRASYSIAELSTAQRRWAEVCISASLTSIFANGSGRGVLLLDEPELALHSRAKSHLTRGLQEFSESFAVDIITATHNSALFDLPGATVFRVLRDRHGHTQVEGLPSPQANNLPDLGLTRADVLQMTRRYILVEGAHDEALLRGAFGAELAATRTTILPLRGARNAAAVFDAQFLLSSTDAEFVVVLDNIDPTLAEVTWQCAREIFGCEGRIEPVIEYLTGALPRSVSSENKFLQELFLAALVTGNHERVRTHTLSEPDIVFYLPVTAFGATSRSWPELLAEHRTSTTKLPFKEWLRKQKGFAFDVERIFAAASRLDAMHPDLVSLSRVLSTPATGDDEEEKEIIARIVLAGPGDDWESLLYPNPSLEDEPPF